MAALQEMFRSALALHQGGRLAEARALYAKVLAADERHFDSLHLLGLALVQAGETEAGAGYIRRALAVRPDVADARYNLGHALLTLGRPAEALAQFDRARELNPSDAQYHVEAGNALKELRRPAEAIARYDEAIRLDPRSAEAHNNRGIALKDAGRPEEAIASYDRAIALRPRYAEAHSNRGNALKDLGRHDEALACHDAALALQPGNAEAHYNRGNVLGEMKRHEEALASYDAALRLRPDYAEARHNRAHLLLGQGRYREGFADYGARWRTPSFGHEPLATSLPRWDGRAGPGELLLWAEQGIGDEILHASLLSLMPEEGPRVTLMADRRLLPVYARSLPGVRVIGREALGEPVATGFTAQAPIGDLGGLLGLDAGRLQARRSPFLAADAQRRAALKASSSFPAAGPVVGLAWKSSNKRFGAEKSLALRDLAPLLALPGLSFVNLQYGDVTEEIAAARAEFGTEVRQVEGVDVFNDIDGLLALVDACDVVVTTSNVTAHLAGAIGKRGAVLVPAGKGALWYWQGGSNNLWYPGLTRIAQQRIGDWQPVIAAAAAWTRENT